jgi:hypothetical protein
LKGHFLVLLSPQTVPSGSLVIPVSAPLRPESHEKGKGAWPETLTLSSV